MLFGGDDLEEPFDFGGVVAGGKRRCEGGGDFDGGVGEIETDPGDAGVGAGGGVLVVFDSGGDEHEVAGVETFAFGADVPVAVALEQEAELVERVGVAVVFDSTLRGAVHDDGELDARGVLPEL